jgi:5-methylthioadenosine/S-adenosylhomocysteine deaminase
VEENVLIIADGFVLTCDPENRAGRLTLAVRSGTIVEIGEDSDAIAARYPGAAVMNASGMLVIPGLVNAHVHSSSLLLRDLTAGLPMSSWRSSPPLRDAAGRMVSPAAAGDLLAVVRAASAAHLKCGTTAIAEMPPEIDADVFRRWVAAQAEPGVNRLTVVRTWDQLGAAREVLGTGTGFAMDLGSEEDFTVYGLESRIHAAREAGIPIAAHVGEMRDGVEIVRRNFQKPLSHVLRDFGALHSDTLCMHLNHCSEHDAAAVREAGCTPAICIGSAIPKQTGYPFLRALFAHDVPLALGTDWGAFDVLAEARLLAQLPAFIPGIPEFSAVELLRMATINGAVALGIAAETGSLEPGKRADLVVLKLDDIRIPAIPTPTSADGLAALLMRSPHRPAVWDVLVRGEFELHNGALVRQDEPSLLEELRRVRERWGMEPPTPLPRQKGDATESAAFPRPKVLQLVPRDAETAPERSQPQPEAPVRERTANLSHPKRRISPKRPPIHPELPKDVRRVFGEDDDL